MVSEGDQIEMNLVKGNVGDKIEFNEVLLVNADTKTEIGTPTLPYVVTGEIVSHEKGEKVEVRKYRAKARYRRVKGHRQELSTIKILKITAGKAAKATATTNKAAEKPAKTTKTATKSKTTKKAATPKAAAKKTAK